MSDRVNYVVVRESGEYELYYSRWGADGLDLDLLAGPAQALAMVQRLGADGWWLNDVFCQGAALIDLGRKVLLLFAWEGPSTVMRYRAATLALLREAWPGWDVRWAYDGPAELRIYLGLDPEHVRDRWRDTYCGPLLEPGDEDLADPEPMAAVVTVGSDRCYVVANVSGHPIREGSALLDRLSGGSAHGLCRVSADAGLHIDPLQRRVGWWVLGASAEAYEMPKRWSGWTVEFWQDSWQKHVRLAPGQFQPPAVDHERARAEVRTAAGRRREASQKHVPET
ncbi:hypothetical protein PV371_37230 [Streptomyces sp. TX20-6-3]|uniref:hypothetical protein n=1 Tax=Streptomyces sp. TX20-6-3 TaxID=3028705 RepID=UPI0029B8EBF1|nr:hypothetical protein [Streptomyces sp. TX20-6-3]MDX2565250.1 hypothetical protein [Streptomyces sp. TX20-6-3]